MESIDEYVISLVIPMYNAEEYLPEIVGQLKAGQDERLEIIFVNDGSKDKSLELLCEMVKGIKNFKIIDQQNHGAPYARNHGMYKAKGKYVWFFDVDDLFEDNAISYALDKLEKDSPDLLIGNMKIVNETGKGRVAAPVFTDKKTTEINKLFFYDSLPGNKIYKRSVITWNKIFWSNVKIHQDLNFYLKFIPFCKNVEYTSNVLYKYIRHEQDSISTTYNLNILDAVKSVYLVKEFYKKNGIMEKYQKELEFNLVKHMFYQINKLKRMKFSDSLYAYLYFRKYLRQVDVKNNSIIEKKYGKLIKDYMMGII